MSNDSSSKFEVCFTIYVTKDGLYVNGGLHIDQQSILKIPLELSQNNKIHIEVEFKGVNKSGVAFLKFIRYSTLLTYTNCPQYVLSALQNAMQYVITVDDADILNEQLEFELIDRKRSVVHLINEDVSTASNHNDVHQFRYIDIFNKKALSFLFGAIAVILVFVVIGGCLYAIKSHFKTVEAENQKYAKDVELQRLARDKQIEETWHRKTLIDSLVECKYNSSKDYLNSYFRDSSKLDRYQLAASLNKAALTKGFVNKEFVDFYINRISSLADYSCSTGSKSDSAICYAKFANSLIGAHPAIEHQARLMYNRKVNICLAKDSLNAQCGYLKMDYLFKASVDTPQWHKNASALGRNLGTLVFLSQLYKKTWQSLKADSINSIGYSYCVDRYTKSKNACRILVSGHVISQYAHSVNAEQIAWQVSKFAQLDSTNSEIQRIASWLFYAIDKKKSLKYARIADYIDANIQNDYEESLKDDLREEIEQNPDE